MGDQEEELATGRGILTPRVLTAEHFGQTPKIRRDNSENGAYFAKKNRGASFKKARGEKGVNKTRLPNCRAVRGYAERGGAAKG